MRPVRPRKETTDLVPALAVASAASASHVGTPIVVARAPTSDDGLRVQQLQWHRSDVGVRLGVAAIRDHMLLTAYYTLLTPPAYYTGSKRQI